MPMIVTTTNDLPGYRVIQHLGLVQKEFQQYGAMGSPVCLLEQSDGLLFHNWR